MDTSVKSYKTSTKILCAVLCIITFLSSMLVGAIGVMTRQYARHHDYNIIDYNYTESTPFRDRLFNDIDNLLQEACSFAYFNENINILKSKKAEVVEKAYNNYKAAKPFIARQHSDNYDEYETTTYSAKYDEYQSIDIYVSNKESYTFNINNIDVFNSYLSSGTEDENTEKAYIEKLYDDFVEERSSYYERYGYGNAEEYTNSMVTYAQNGTTVSGNTKDVTAEKARTHNIYLIYQNGELEYKGIPESTADEIKTKIIDANEISKKTTLIIWFNDFPSTAQSILNYRYWNDYYISLFSFNKLAYHANKSPALILLSAVILLAISFAAGFSFFKMSGRKNKQDKAQLLRIDKIPIELHLLLTVIAGVLLCIAWTFIINIIPTEYSILFILTFAGALTVLQGLMLEFCTSVARCAHSENGIKNSFLTIKVTKKAANQFKKMAALLSYKPGAMKKNATILTILYFFGNAVLLGFILLLWATFSAPGILLSILLLMIDLAINVYIIIKVISYLKNLDTIITAFSNKVEPALDIGRLPQSLRILADSMKYTNEELQSAIEKAVKDERLRSELITNVSHDLKTPLTSIITYVDLLSKCDIDDEKAKEYIGVLDDKGAKLKRLIEDLIEASKVTSGNVTVNLTNINLSELCLQSTIEAQADFEKAGLDLIVKNCENPPIVTADGPKAFRIIENLLSNARKYSAAGSRVYVEVYDTDRYGIFEIKNISAEPLDISPDELTERFVRGDKSRNQEGNGLGLSIAKELCRLQHGNLELIIDGDLFKARVKLPK